MKVAVVQLRLRKNLERAFEDAERLVKVAAKEGAHLVCLPEHWLLDHVLEPRDSILRRFRGLAESTGVYLNLGANYLRRSGVTYLSSQTISPEGEVVSVQDKLHLFGREWKTASPGTHLRTLEIEGNKVGVLVCHDLVFPEPARALTLMGTQLLIVPSLIESAGSSPWLAYLRARALENRIPILSPNAYAPPRFLGKSTIIDLQYNMKRRIMLLNEKIASKGPCVLSADIDLLSLEGPRSERIAELKNSRIIQSFYHNASKLIADRHNDHSSWMSSD